MTNALRNLPDLPVQVVQHIDTMAEEVAAVVAALQSRSR